MANVIDRRMVLERVASMPDKHFARVEDFVVGLGYSREGLRALNKRPAKPRAKARAPGDAPALRLVVNNTGENAHG